jgi:hypothetical protein
MIVSSGQQSRSLNERLFGTAIFQLSGFVYRELAADVQALRLKTWSSFQVTLIMHENIHVVVRHLLITSQRQNGYSIQEHGLEFPL